MLGGLPGEPAAPAPGAGCHQHGRLLVWSGVVPPLCTREKPRLKQMRRCSSDRYGQSSILRVCFQRFYSELKLSCPACRLEGKGSRAAASSPLPGAGGFSSPAVTSQPRAP